MNTAQKRPRNTGMTILEMIIAVAISGIVVVMIAKALPSFESFLGSYRLRQKANTEARITQDTVRHLLSHARPSTLTITYPITVPVATINFTTLDGTQYQIGCWVDNRVYYTQQPPGGTVSFPKILAQNVTGFSFAKDTNDPTGIVFTYLSETTLNSSGKTDSVYAVQLNTEIRMEGN